MPPEAFTQSPTLEDVVYVVNANTQRVQQLQTENATLRIEGVPALRANLAYEHPRNFRLHAQLSQFTGRELDMGSNDELFWFWIQRDEQPTVYFARHDEFASSPARDLVPIEPNRLIDTLGLVWLDPQGQHIGPVERDSNLLEVRSRIPSPRGDMTRVLLIDAKYGWIVEQHFYDANGQLLLSARASRHRYYPEDAVTMPHHVEVRLMPGQPSQLAFDVDVGNYVFNRLSGDAVELWAMPQIEGYPAVDIADPRFRPPVAAVPSDVPSAVPCRTPVRVSTVRPTVSINRRAPRTRHPIAGTTNTPASAVESAGVGSRWLGMVPDCRGPRDCRASGPSKAGGRRNGRLVCRRSRWTTTRRGAAELASPANRNGASWRVPDSRSVQRCSRACRPAS